MFPFKIEFKSKLKIIEEFRHSVDIVGKPYSLSESPTSL